MIMIQGMYWFGTNNKEGKAYDSNITIKMKMYFKTETQDDVLETSTIQSNFFKTFPFKLLRTHPV